MITCKVAVRDMLLIRIAHGSKNKVMSGVEYKAITV